MNKCATCKFWNDSTKHRQIADHLKADCRVDSPLVNEQAEAVWPQTYGKDWCGKFRPVLSDIY